MTVARKKKGGDVERRYGRATVVHPTRTLPTYPGRSGAKGHTKRGSLRSKLLTSTPHIVRVNPESRRANSPGIFFFSPRIRSRLTEEKRLRDGRGGGESGDSTRRLIVVGSGRPNRVSGVKDADRA
ncbi:hypothetical protein MRX96_014382 [Rhipicephalus microplus]